MIKIECPTCNRRLKCPDNLAGKAVKCPHCETPMRIPSLLKLGKPNEPVERPNDGNSNQIPPSQPPETPVADQGFNPDSIAQRWLTDEQFDVGSNSQGPVADQQFESSEMYESIHVHQRFPNCRRYVGVLSTITQFMIAICAFLPVPGLMLLWQLLAKEYFENNTMYLAIAIVVIGFGSLAWWVILLWIYTCIMCGLELIEAVVEIEHNTRTTSTWLEKLCNKQSR